MKRPDNYTHNGPSYKDQMYDTYLSYGFYPGNIKGNIWDTAVSRCEEVHNERIRNILSPIVNIIQVIKNINNNPEKTEYYMSLVDKTDLIKHCDIAVERLLNITEQ